jgi:Flp pilus assembly protein CpaB
MSKRTRVIALRVAITIVVFLTVRLVAVDLAALHRAADRAGRTAPMVVARRDLAVGQLIAAGDLAIRRVPVDALPARGLTNPSVVVGQYVRVTVFTGVAVTAGALAVHPPGVAADSRVVTVTFSATPALHRGDQVDVFRAVRDAGATSGDGGRAVLVASAATVQSVDTAAGRSGEPHVTLRLRSADTAAVLAGAADNSLQLAVRPTG